MVMAECELSTGIQSGLGSEDRFRSIVDGIPSLVTILTPAGELEFANRQVLEYFCATLEELKNWAPFVHPDDRSRVLASWKHSVETGASYDIEQRIRRADGVYRWFHMHGFPLRDPDGRIGLWYVLPLLIKHALRRAACRE